MHMAYSKNRGGRIVFYSIIIGILYILYVTSYEYKVSIALCSSILSQKYHCLPLDESTVLVNAPKDELEIALEEASMGNNKTLIITLINQAYVEGEKAMLNLFLESFWLGENTRSLVNQLLLVTVDQVAFERCKFLRLHCYKLATKGDNFAGEKVFMSNDFINMMWRRTLFLGDVLKRGYSFIFTDTDVMWLSNPFSRLSKDQNEDLQISVDRFNGDPWSELNPLNTGFYFVRSNNKTIALFEKWYKAKDDPRYEGMKEQDVLTSLMIENSTFVSSELGLKVRFLDTLYFSGFCQDSWDMNVVCTVHANCCRHIKAKLEDLTVVHRDWREFKVNSISNKALSTVGWSPHLECMKSWEY